MIGQAEVAAAFSAIAPAVMTGDPEGALRNLGVDPNAIQPLGVSLTQLYAMQEIPPEDAVPASFIIGILLGLTLDP